MMLTAIQASSIYSRGLVLAASLTTPQEILAQISRCQTVLYAPIFDAAAFRTVLAPLSKVSIKAIRERATQADLLAANYERMRQPRIKLGKLLSDMKAVLPVTAMSVPENTARHLLEHLAGPPPKLTTMSAARYFAPIPWEQLRADVRAMKDAVSEDRRLRPTYRQQKPSRAAKRGGKKGGRRSKKAKKDRLHRIANTSEAPILNRLREVAKRYGAEVFLKMRVGAVLKIKRGVIEKDLFEFAKKGEFDFVVATGKGNNKYPLFALEFDGPLHGSDFQKANDAKKDALCEHFNFPLLRIGYNDQRKYGAVDLVTCLAELGLLAEAFQIKKEKGKIPKDVPFNLVNIMAWSDPKQRIPVWLGFVRRMQIQRLYEEDLCGDPIPSCLVGLDEEGNYRALASIRLADRRKVVSVETRLRKQLYPYIPVDLLEELAVHELYAKLSETLKGDLEGETKPSLNKKISKFRDKYEVLREV